MNNFDRGGKRDSQGNVIGKTAEKFEFWIYTAAPADGVHVQDVYGHFSIYRRTWPILRVTLQQAEPAALGPDDSITLELPVPKDGSVALPATLPPGLWSLTAAMKKEGMAICQCEDGRSVEGPFSFDKMWHKPFPVRFYLKSPLRKVNIKTSQTFPALILENCKIRPSESIATDGPLMTTVDAARSQSAQLEMTGANLTGAAPTLPILTGGRRTAVLTSWDDGAEPDLRLAEILHRLGYRPTFFLNHNNPAMKFLDKLAALDVEIGSHCYHHPFLYLLLPERAKEECVEMRKLLEKELKHPVISFGYPNGYTPAYDAEGDYVLGAVRAAGYWSGRATSTGMETYDSIEEPLAMRSNGFFGDRKGLEKAWAETRAKEGGIFYFWGHSWQIGKTDEQWQDFEKFVAQFAHQPDTWYASVGELTLWLWARKNVQMAVAEKSPGKVTVTLTRPWLHPWLSAQCPLSLKVPPGVESVRWQGESVPIKNGLVELPWVSNE
jgi:peptidoglycan/xylan/chitin deacetylase (PgdA/CDA1 family)